MLALLLAFLQPFACSALTADWIEARDLARLLPAFSQLDPQLRLGPAPYPGFERTYHVAELRRLAAAHKIEAGDLHDVCFGWPTAVPERSNIKAAMQRTLANRHAAIEIVDSQLNAVPPGDLAFPLSGLTVSTDKPALWRGYVSYAGGRRFAVWARAIVTVQEQHLVAGKDLKYGRALEAGDLQTVSYSGPIGKDRFLSDPAAVIGSLLKRPLAAGSPLTEEMLEAPREVTQGDLVSATVETGAARLIVQGIAQANGRKGDVISIRNPRSGRLFRARVEDKNAVVVVPGGPVGLAVEEPRKS